MKRRWPYVPACLALALVVSLVRPVAALEEADRLWLVGERAFADALYPVSRRALERFVAQYPSDKRLPDAVLLLGRARLQLGDAQAALESFKRAAAFTPPPGRPQEPRFWEGEALFRLKRYPEARAAYDDVLRADAAGPMAAEALYGRSWTDLELKNAEAAITGFRDLISTWPDHALAPSTTLQLARTLGEQKKTSEALALLQDFAAKYPRSRLGPDAQFLTAWLKLNGGDRDAGLADLRAFIAANPDHDQAPAARRLLEQASADVHYNAAKAAMRQGRPKDVEAAWKKLSADFPDHALTRRLALELASQSFKQKNWKSAASYATHATRSEDEGEKAEAWLLVGESELKQKRAAPAAKAFEAVGAIEDVEAGVRFRALAGLGLAREEQQQWKAALTAYEAVAKRSPDATLRDWAKQRAADVKSRMAAPTPPASKPAPKKDSRS
jgi:TolA-binding protein